MKFKVARDITNKEHPWMDNEEIKKGGKENKRRNTEKRIKGFKNPTLYEVDDKRRMLRKDRAYKDGKRVSHAV